jgi:AraC-like DNA-binding protein
MAVNMAGLRICIYIFSMTELDGYLLAPPREAFSLSRDTYSMWCLLLPRTGAFSFEISGGPEGVARFGDIVVCPPGATLRRRMLRPTSFFHARFDTALNPPIGRTRVPDLDRLRADLGLVETAEAHASLVARHVVTDLLLMMVRARRDAPCDELIGRATTYILDHFDSPDLSLGDLAAILEISPAQLSRRFKAARGITPVAYLRNVRLRRARELLAETDDTLQSIAERCGYRNAFYLSRVFTSHSGQTPSAYRQSNRV